MALDPGTGTRPQKKKRPGPRDTRTVSTVLAEAQRRHAARQATVDAAPRSVFIPPALAAGGTPQPVHGETWGKDRQQMRPGYKRPKSSDIDEAFRLALGRPARVDISKQPQTDVSAVPKPQTRLQRAVEERDRAVNERTARYGPGMSGRQLAKGIAEGVWGMVGPLTTTPQSAIATGDPMTADEAEANLESLVGKSVANLALHGDVPNTLGEAAGLGIGVAGVVPLGKAGTIAGRIARKAPIKTLSHLDDLDEVAALGADAQAKVAEWRALEQLPKKTKAQTLRQKELGDELTLHLNASHPELAGLKDLSYEKSVEGVDMSVFRGHNTESMLRQLPVLLARGLGSRYWYQDSAREILAMAGGDKELASRYAQVIAIYSAQRKPAENINLATEALRQFQNNETITVGTRSQKRKATAVMNGGYWKGRKTDRFFKNLLEDIDEDAYLKEFGGTGEETTNDIWVARLFGLKTDAPTPREYEEINKILVNVAETLGWKPKEVQAAVWGPIRKDAEIAKKLRTGSKKPVLLEDTSMDFQEALLQESGRIPFSARPGLRSAPERRAAYDALPPAAREAVDRETITAVATFLNASSALAKVGWRGVVDSVSTVLMPAAGQGHSAKIAMKLRSRQALDSTTAIVADALQADSGYWYRPFYKASHSMRSLNGAKVQLGRGLTPEEITGIEAAMLERGIKVTLPPEPDGFSVLVQNQPGSKKLVADVEAALDSVFTDTNAKLNWFAYKSNTLKRGSNGKFVHTRSGWAGRPDIQRAADRLEATITDIHHRHLGGEPPSTARFDAAVERRKRGVGVPFTALDVDGATRYLEGQRARNTRGWNLSEPDPADLAAGRSVLHVNEAGVGYYVRADGYGGYLHNNSGIAGAGQDGLLDLIHNGVTHFDAYDGFLPKLYTEFGFREVGRTKFVDEFAPDGWDYKAQGRPDIVFMAYAPKLPLEKAPLGSYESALKRAYEAGKRFGAKALAKLKDETGSIRFGKWEDEPTPPESQILYHGSPEGVIGDVDPYHHTKPWEEGIGFYITESPEKAAGYARGRTASAARKGAGTGAVTRVTLKPDARVLDMDAPADIDLWREMTRSAFTDEEFDHYILRQAGENPTNKRLREEVLTQLQDEHGNEALYALEEGFEKAGVQATTHMEGVRSKNPHRVWVVKDKNAVEILGGTGIKHETGWEPTPAAAAPPPEAPTLPGEMPSTLHPTAADLAAAPEPHPFDPTDPAFARAELAKPADDIRRMLPTARARIRAQNELRTAELASRVAKGREAFESGLEGEAAYEAAKAELRGEMPKLDLVEGGIVDFNQTQVDAMMSIIRINDELRFLEKIRAMGAVRKAVNGRLPQKNEIALLERVFGHQLTASVVKSVHGWKKWKQMGYQVIGIPRSFQASVDLSAPFRQGLVLGARHPVLFARNLPKMVKSAGSQPVWDEMMEEIGNRSTYDLMKRAKVFFSGLDDMSEHEEQFTSNLAETITGGKYSPVRASGRGYSGFLNKFRADAFDTYVRTLEHQGVDLNDPKNQVLLESIGEWINMASGRGKAPFEVMEGANQFLNTLFFSPRLAYSRLSLLNPGTYLATPGGKTPGRLKSKFARQQARRGMGQLAIAVGLTLGIAKSAGADIEYDPRSSDFGKIRVGDSRYDVSGGLLGFMVLAAREGWMSTKSSTTGEIKPLTGGFGKPSPWSVFGGFVTNKLAPVPHYAVNLMKNENFEGDPMYGEGSHYGHLSGVPGWAKEIGKSSFPLGLGSTYDAYQVQGPGAAAATFGLGSIGFGANTYKQKAPKADVKKYKEGMAQVEQARSTGLMSDVDAEQARNAIEHRFVASVRKKHLKARGLSEAEFNRQTILSNVALAGVPLEEINSDLQGSPVKPFTEKEYAKTVRELLEIEELEP